MKITLHQGDITKIKVDAIVNDLPEDTEKPKVLKIDINAIPIITLALTGDLSLDEARLTAAMGKLAAEAETLNEDDPKQSYRPASARV